MGVDSYYFLHVLILNISHTLAFCMKPVFAWFALDSVPSEYHESVTFSALFLHLMCFFSTPPFEFCKDFSNDFVHKFAKITAREAPIAKPSDC